MSLTIDTTLAACPACGAAGHRPFGERNGLRLVRCRGCSLVYSNPQPRERVAERYLEAYDLADHFGRWEQRKQVIYERHFAWLPEAAAGANRVCDIGCGDGQFLALARDRGWEPFGVELNPPAAEHTRQRGITVHEGFFEVADDLPWGTFDLVCTWDCIEHTPEPAAFVERLARLLRPGGTLALTTLNVRSLVARAFRMRWSMVVDDHYTYWDLGSLTALLAGAGLTVEQSHTYGLGRDFAGWVDRFAQRRPVRADEPAVGAEPEPSVSWDARAPIVRAEVAVNRVLDALNLGVGIAIRARLA